MSSMRSFLFCGFLFLLWWLKPYHGLLTSAEVSASSRAELSNSWTRAFSAYGTPRSVSGNSSAAHLVRTAPSDPDPQNPPSFHSVHLNIHTKGSKHNQRRQITMHDARPRAVIWLFDDHIDASSSPIQFQFRQNLN